MLISRRGLMLVLSSPSGAGKTTIARELLEHDTEIIMSVSATTRAPRPGEIDGHDYFFVNKKQFEKMIHDDELLEHAEVFGNLYGTPKNPVLNHLRNGKDILFDIDWQGTQQMASFARNDLVSIFILPPDGNTLKQRLIARGQDSMDTVNYRMSQAENEMTHWPEYDYVIVNQDLEQSLDQVRSILKAERLKRSRQVGLVNFVKHLKQSLSCNGLMT